MVCVPKIAEKKKNLFAALHFLLLIVLSICHVVFYSTAIFSNVICPGNSGVQVTNIVLCGGTSHPNCLFQNLCGCDSEVQVNLTTANTAKNVHVGVRYKSASLLCKLWLWFFFCTAALSYWDFSHGKFRLLSLGKASCNRVALPNLRCMLGVLAFS